ncbi:MAG: hypothetical protein JSS27_04645 [Planctomycetes bacterium]|nr:hypothetical protein [Planctomycetota bacterium]
MFTRIGGGLIVLSLATIFGAENTQADVAVRSHVKSNGAYVRPHYRSNPDGIFANNWSAAGNINPYTGAWGTRSRPSNSNSYRTSPSLYASSAPSLGNYSPAYDYGLESPQERIAVERVRRETELAAQAARRHEMEAQQRRAGDARTNVRLTEAIVRWQTTEDQIQSAKSAAVELETLERRQKWSEENASLSRESLAKLQRNIAEYEQKWDLNEALDFEEGRKLIVGAELRYTRANARAKSAQEQNSATYKYDLARTRAEAFRLGELSVQQQRAMQFQRECRNLAVSEYRETASARHKAEEQARVASFKKQDAEIIAATKVRLDQEARQRFADFQREKETILAHGRAETETDILALHQRWDLQGDASESVHADDSRPTQNRQGLTSDDRLTSTNSTTSGPVDASTAGIAVAALSGFVAFLRFKFGVG